MTRKATPTDLLDVSQETPVRAPASSRLIDVLDLDGASPPIVLYSEAPELVPLYEIDDNPYQPRTRYDGIRVCLQESGLAG